MKTGAVISESNPALSVIMTATKSCIKHFTFCADKAVRRGATAYTTLMTAYLDAADNDFIEMLAANLPENLTLNRPVAVTLKGGYSYGYGDNPSMTITTGSVVISSASVTAENLIIVGTLLP